MSKKQKNQSNGDSTLGKVLVGGLIGIAGLAVGYFAGQEGKKDEERKHKAQLEEQRIKQEVQQRQNTQNAQKNVVKHEVTLKDDELNENLFCPISYTLMTDPVLIKTCGHTFQKDSIQNWIKDHEDCPVCKERCTLTDLVPNYTLKGYVEDMIKKQEGDLKLSQQQNQKK